MLGSELWRISTPIGNLEDCSIRLKKTIEECDVLLVESLKKYRNLHASLGISTSPKVFKWSLNKKSISKKKLASFFLDGKNIGLISDAGAPNIADPGYQVVYSALENNASIFSLPGPSSVSSALSLSRWPTLPCFIWGFPPKGEKKIFSWLSRMSNMKGTHLAFVNPSKLKDFIFLIDKFINVDLQLFSEISKIHEKRIDGSPQKVLRSLPSEVKGEWVILIKFI